MYDLKSRVAFITGAGRGIGASIAEMIAEAGADIAIVDMDLETATKTAKEISEKYKVKTMPIKCNVASLEEVQDSMKKVADELGKINILINNAGITRDKLVLRMSEDDWKSVIDVNLTGTFNCSKTVIKQMSKTGGSIINMASVIGIMGNAGQANYAASKAGIIGLTKSIAKEYAKKNIRVNAVAPGFIETKMTDELNDEYKASLVQNIPLGRMGQPEEIANLVTFLVSDRSKYITGQVITIDGGMVM